MMSARHAHRPETSASSPERAWCLLAGWRDVPTADTWALVPVLTAVSQLLADVPQIAKLDITLLLAGATDFVALDARVRVRADAPDGAATFAIRPYPSELGEMH